MGYFGIIAPGENRMINEFESGNVYMIKGNRATDFTGEIIILARMEQTSVTIEVVTDDVVAYISHRGAECWLIENMSILHLTTRRTTFELYRSSYNNGAKLFYPPSCLLLDYVIRYRRRNNMDSAHSPKTITVGRTHQMFQEEIGVNVRTLNRTIRQLEGEGFFDPCKGELTFSKEQHRAAMD